MHTRFSETADKQGSHSREWFSVAEMRGPKNDPPPPLGRISASTHRQGLVEGTLLIWLINYIRRKTNTGGGRHTYAVSTLLNELLLSDRLKTKAGVGGRRTPLLSQPMSRHSLKNVLEKGKEKNTWQEAHIARGKRKSAHKLFKTANK